VRQTKRTQKRKKEKEKKRKAVGRIIVSHAECGGMSRVAASEPADFA
jgi:hypothetical protein